VIEKILYEIDQINDTSYEYQMEMFDTMNALFEKEYMMMEYATDPELTIQEAAATAPKESFGNKIISFLKKVFEAINRAISKMVNAIVSLFSKNKGKKTPNTIASQIVGTVKPTAAPKVTNNPNISTSVKSGVRTFTIKLPTNKRSTVKVPPLNIPQSDIEVIFQGDNQIIFRREGKDTWGSPIFQNVSDEDRKIIDREPKKANSVQSAVVSLKLICNRQDQDQFFKYLEQVVNSLNMYSGSRKLSGNSSYQFRKAMDSLHSICKGGTSRISNPDSKEFKTSINEIKEFQKRFARLHEQFLKVFDTDIDFSKNTDIVRDLTDIGDDLAVLQMSLNTVTNQIVQQQCLNPRYWKTIQDPRLLAKFTKACIDSGIPYKFVMYNVWLVSDDDLHGGLNDYAPVWGQSRGVFFPLRDQNIIYKIALSGWGITSNKTEADITKMLSNTGDPDDIKIIPKVLDSYEEYTLLKMERIRPARVPSSSSSSSSSSAVSVSASELRERFERALDRYNSRHHKNVRITITDLHSANVAYDEKRNGPVIVDYGWGERYR